MNEIPNFIDKSLEKLFDEPAVYSGNLTKNVINILFGKINYYSDYLDITRKHKHELRIKKFLEKHSKITVENECTPPFEVISKFGNCIVEYVDNEPISDMFYNLLLASFNTDFTSFVHPAFVEIIKQLSPVDARMLKDIKNRKHLEGFTVLKENSDDLPISLLKTDLILEFGIEQCAFSISNLRRLGLIDLDIFLLEKNSARFVGENESSYFFETLDDWFIVDSGYPNQIESLGYSAYTCRIFLNSFGRNFLKVCIE